MRTTVYVDGFNLYYGALKRTSFKWLNLEKLCHLLLPKQPIQKIKYFTALVNPRPGDPNVQVRQQIYLRALKTLPKVEIIHGHFLTKKIDIPLIDSSLKFQPRVQLFARLTKTEEKGSDVNLAAHLINDGHKKNIDKAVLITNDSDLLEAVRIIRRELKLPVGIINPHERQSRVLIRHASFVKKIRKGALSASQFPKTLKDVKGVFHKPETW